ncbi:hypothetical protein ACFYWS_09760 [Streptomyces sp. NPDC002795]|uniref:hypothetical protein n=1 Tax=Streptomyces sp. NPDC002795 TaxID=3364665 RepID=UPI0036A49C9C
MPDDGRVLFLEVFVQDSSDFTEGLLVHGDEKHGVRRLRVRGPGVPHVCFHWTEGPVTREVLRGSEPDPERRPRGHVG